jgi:sugar lactone lactonase YvrE
VLVPRSRRTRFPRLRRPLAITLAALALPAGAALAGLSGIEAPIAGAAAPTPTLYVADYGAGEVANFPLSASGNVAPSAVNTSSALNNEPSGSVLDAAGDLWVASWSPAPNVSMFTPSQLATTGTPTPAVEITSTYSGAEPNGLAFDSKGDLWVSSFNGGPVAEYTASQLATSGSPTPAVLIHNPGSTSWGLSFDTAGNLWVGGYSSGQLWEYAPSQLAASGTPTPAVTITGVTEPVFPIVDAMGNLWVSDYGSGKAIDKFTPDQLTTSGSPTPAVQITSTSFGNPCALAFDTAGNLRMADYGAAGVFTLSPAQLASSGNVTPASTLQGAATTFSSPCGLALVQAPVVTSVSPTSGPPGSTVTIKGAGFLSGSNVSFGSTPATSVTYLTPNEIQATAPFGAGTVDVTVSTSGGTSATSAADQFAYTGSGYLEVASDGGIFNYGASFHGSMGGKHLNAPIVGIAADPATGGYWEVAADGGVFAFNAPFLGSRGGQPLNAPIVGMAATMDGGGYWLVAKDGGIFNYGDAAFAGSMGGKHLNAPVVGIAADTATGGYWEVATDGGIFNFNAPFRGSRGGQLLNAPVVGIAAGAGGAGYWLVAKDGGIFNYGVSFVGSRGGQPLNAPIVGIAAAGAAGYWEVATDGGIFNYGAPFLGSRGGQPLNAPVVGITAG